MALVPAQALYVLACRRLGRARRLHFLAVFHILAAPGLALSILFFGLAGMLVISEDDTVVSRLRLSYTELTGLVRLAVLLIGVVVVFAACACIARATLSELFVEKAATDYNVSGALAPSLALVHDALVIDPQNALAHRAGVELGLLQLQQMVASGDTSDTAALQTTLSQTIAEGLAAVSIDSGDYQNWLTLAQAYHQLGGQGLNGAYDNARAAYEKSAAANPSNPLPLMGAAQVAILQSDASSSLAYLSKALALKPDLAAAYYLRSQVEAGEGSNAAALEDARSAVALVPQDPLGWYNLGAVLYSANDASDAAIALKQAIALSNNYANALFLLSLALENSGDHLGAIDAMQKVVALNPSNTTALSALAQLQAQKATPTSQSTTAR